jgi:hypothetical protein
VLSDIATTNTDIASSLSLIAGSDYANIAASLDNISNNFGTIATISTGTGIHTAKAYDWLGSMAMYRLFVEQGKAIDTSSNITSTLKLPGNIIGTNGPNNLTLDSTIGVAVNDTVTIQHNYAGLTTGTYYVMSVDKATNIVTLSTTTSASGLITYITTSTDVSTCTNVVSAPLHAFETYVQKVGSLPTNF